MAKRRSAAKTSETKREYNLRDPSDNAAAVAYVAATRHPITDADADTYVFHWADEVAKVDLDPVDRRFLNFCRAQFSEAVATRNNPSASENSRRQANMTAIRAAFDIGEIKGRMATALWARKAHPRLATRKASEGRVNITPRQIEKLETFRKAKGWRLDDLSSWKKQQLADELDVTIHRLNSYLRKLRDISS